jgi:diacylglycerol kinase family enzyme
LRRHGLLVEMRATAGPQDAGRLAEETGPETDMVVAVGGDGTINEIANGLAQRAARERAAGRSWQPLLGIVPAGTVNVLALELGIPFQVEKACRVIAAGHAFSLDLGKVNDRRFTLMMGVGIDALTIHNLNLEAKRRFHEWAVRQHRPAHRFRRLACSVLGTGGRQGIPQHLLRRGNTHYYGAASGDP